MGYVYLLCVALMFSFGGTCVKLISPYFNASWITFFRFFIGVVWLLILKCILRQPFQKNLKQALLSCWKWILFGAFIKWMAYLTENYALSHGLSYGNIVTQPAQTLFLTLVSVLCFKDKAVDFIKSLKNVTTGRLIAIWQAIRTVASAFSLRIGGHVQFIRPLINPMAQAAAVVQYDKLDEKTEDQIKGMCSGSENYGNFFAQNCFMGSSGTLLIVSTLSEQG